MAVSPESIANHIPYYLTGDKKDALVKALKDFPDHFNYYLNRYEGELLQGDGQSGLPVFRFSDGDRKNIKGIVLSNSCDIDVENKRDIPANIVFAPIVKLKAYSELLSGKGIDDDKIEAKLEAIRGQRVTNCFFLPGEGTLEEDYVAFLDDVHTVPLDDFLAATNENRKLFTLSQAGFYLFLLKISIHFCRFHEEVDRFPLLQA